MAIPLKKSTASQEIVLGPFVDSSDGVTPENALSIANTDIKIWKAGATTLADKTSGGATYITSSNGHYYAVLDATDTDTYGPLVVNVYKTGALPVRLECVVMSVEAYDTLYGTDAFTADLTAAALASVNAEVDTALNTAIPGSPVADSINQRIKAIDDLTQAAGAGDLAAILVDTGTTLETTVNAIKAKTDSLTYTIAGVVDANIQRINDVTITGNGSPSSRFGV